MTEQTEIKLPDEMGVWSEDGEVWLPKAHYPKRSQAIQWATEQWSCGWRDVRCLSRSMRHQPFFALDADGSVAWREDQWYECARDEPDSFPVWRLEGQ